MNENLLKCKLIDSVGKLVLMLCCNAVVAAVEYIVVAGVAGVVIVVVIVLQNLLFRQAAYPLRIG